MINQLAISVPEAAKMLGISRNFAYSLVRDGKLPSRKLGERRIVIPIKNLEEFIQSNTTAI